MTPIHVLGVGLSGSESLTPTMASLVMSADILIGGERHLGYFKSSDADKWILDDLSTIFQRLQTYLNSPSPGRVCVLVTGDPLFFGLGRLLLLNFSPDLLTFYPTLSSIQMAFSRLKMPWQDAKCVSVHGRAFEALGELLRKGFPKIAVLTDPNHSPAAIARYLQSLDLPMTYQFWVCENLGGEEETVQCFDIEKVQTQAFASLTVLILLKQVSTMGREIAQLPMIGVPDRWFQGFDDRPGLMTKREIRVLALSELALVNDCICWDIGAGTGSVSVEMARCASGGTVYAVEQSTAGQLLIRKNSEAMAVSNVVVIPGKAPQSLRTLPRPDRVFIGGSGRQLCDILSHCDQCLKAHGVMVLAITTLETLQVALTWFQSRSWQTSLLHVQLSRTTPIAELTRLKPLNPVYLMTAKRSIP